MKIMRMLFPDRFEWGWHYVTWEPEGVPAKERYVRMKKEEVEFMVSLQEDNPRFTVSEVVVRRKAGKWIQE